MDAYGAFITAFPELMQTVTVWTEYDRSDKRQIRVLYVPSKGDVIKRRKYTSGNTLLDIQGDDVILVHTRYTKEIKIGDYVLFPDDDTPYRITAPRNYSNAADFRMYGIQRLTGADDTQQERLEVKEPYFA